MNKKIHYMKLNNSPFNKIIFGNKTIELRLNDLKRQKLKIGHYIEFINTNNKSLKVLTIITDILKFSSFKELYRNVSLVDIGYKEAELSNVTYKDMNQYYSNDKQAKYGVLAIKLKVIK